ncbi:hypothetical protein M7784_04140 [Desulfovibrio aminophilus]|nr:hypothetical protein [Desulfovibrio aminophilus]MCM0754433.1 hypothetical protein [Desulfovibrio aminophilus]
MRKQCIECINRRPEVPREFWGALRCVEANFRLALKKSSALELAAKSLMIFAESALREEQKAEIKEKCGVAPRPKGEVVKHPATPSARVRGKTLATT